MNDALYLSFYLLWVLVIFLSIMVLYLYRIIHKSQQKRVLAKSEDGLAKGKIFPLKEFKTYEGDTVNIETKTGTVLIFTKYNCEVCKRVYTALPIVRQKYSSLNIITLMVASLEEAQSVVEDYKINTPIVLIKNEELAEMKVQGFPFAYYLSATGSVVSKGVVNFPEHFDILISQQKAA